MTLSKDELSGLVERVRLTDLERQVLKAWEGTCLENNVFPFRHVASEASVDQSKIRRVVRSLARKGALEFCRMSWSDEGPSGAGYMPTDLGYALLLSLQSQEPTP